MDQTLYKYLSKRDFADLLSLSYASLDSHDYDSFEDLLWRLKTIIPVETVFCASGNIRELYTKPEPNTDIFHLSYPEEYVEQYFQNKYYLSDEVNREFIRTLKPVNWFEIDKRTKYGYPAARLAREFNMLDGWMHGVMDAESTDYSCLYIGGPFRNADVKTQTIIEYIVPFLCQAYQRVLQKRPDDTVNLTQREIEILNWIKNGKSSWEISVILGCSKRVVDFHASNVQKKLNAASRTHAVVMALERGIIRF